MMRACVVVSVVAASISVSARADAYPSAVIFAPTGEAKSFATVGTFIYTALLYRPQVAPSVTWVGANVGVMPSIAYGASGLRFGGLEIGLDAINPFTRPGEGAYVKPVFNAKLQLLTEGTWSPSVAVGAMELALFEARDSQSLGYVAMTKTLKIDERIYGRVTLGLGASVTRDPDVFRATPPFEGTRLLPLVGLESPAFGPFSFAVDHVGGHSEVSSTNLALNIAPLEGVTWAFGAFFANDRAREATTYDGLFTYLAFSSSVTAWFRSRAPADRK